jgi:glycosyltransferase involved in cell wall biosynthesis
MKQFEGRDFTRVSLVPNAANFHLFNQALDKNLQVHQAIPSGRKTIGYLGNIERRIDFHLLLQLMERLSDFQLIMAGPIELKYVPEEVLHHPRIKFIGAVAHEDAPSVLKGFDVAIIPFLIDEVSDGIYPLKLFEYLATGKPILNIGPKDGDAAIILTENAVSITLDSNESEKMVEFILNSQDKSESITRSDKFSRRNLTKEMAELIFN